MLNYSIPTNGAALSLDQSFPKTEKDYHSQKGRILTVFLESSARPGDGQNGHTDTMKIRYHAMYFPIDNLLL